MIPQGFPKQTGTFTYRSDVLALIRINDLLKRIEYIDYGTLYSFLLSLRGFAQRRQLTRRQLVALENIEYYLECEQIGRMAWYIEGL